MKSSNVVLLCGEEALYLCNVRRNKDGSIKSGYVLNGCWTLTIKDGCWLSQDSEGHTVSVTRYPTDVIEVTLCKNEQSHDYSTAISLARKKVEESILCNSSTIADKITETDVRKS